MMKRRFGYEIEELLNALRRTGHTSEDLKYIFSKFEGVEDEEETRVSSLPSNEMEQSFGDN